MKLPDVMEALNGARDIRAEELSDKADLLGDRRAILREEAVATAKVVPGKEAEAAKLSDPFDHSEKWAGMPSHNALALLRGLQEGVIRFDVAPDEEVGHPHRPHDRSDLRSDQCYAAVMPWKPTSDMTRDQLVQQLDQLREIVERLAAKIMPVPDDDRTLHDLSREELLGQVMRLREELNQRDAPQPTSGREMHELLDPSGPPKEITLEQMRLQSRKD